MAEPPGPASRAAVQWLDRHPCAPGLLLPLADEAWFWRMAVLRHGPELEQLGAPTARLAECLAAALRTDVDALLAAAREQGPECHGDQVLGALMLAHLLADVRPDEPGTAALAAVVRAEVGAHQAELRARSPLHALCLDHNWRGLTGRPLEPVQPPQRWPGPPWQRLLVASYFHTHVVLFASGTLARPPDDLEALAGSLAFLRRNAPRVLGLGWPDVCAEYVLALAVCGDPPALIRAMQEGLRAWQRPDGGWLTPDVGLRRARHAAMVAALALLEGGGVPATAGRRR